VAKEPVEEGWVPCFINRNNRHLISQWTARMDRVRHNADLEAKYKLYLNLLHQKIKEYKIKPCQMYIINERGFIIGVTSRSKRIFSRRM
ncbi:hypothetical protein EJ02DRAFT_352497, partial [Clathrospora elynae]